MDRCENLSFFALFGVCGHVAAGNRRGLTSFTPLPSAVAGPREDKNGVSAIENEKQIIYQRVDYAPIRDEYISGGTSYAKLAEKYGVSAASIGRRARAEGWISEREKARIATIAQSIQKTANSAAENAVKAQRIKSRLLDRLEELVERQLSATEARAYDPEGNLTEVHRLRDLTAAYKDLTEDMPKSEAPNDLLQSLLDLEREARS